jgi:hypothetical protein
MKVFLIIFLFYPLIASAQWSSVQTLNSPENYSFVIKNLCVADENKVFVGGYKMETWSSPLYGVVYFTLDGGNIWDSLEFENRFIDAIVSSNPNNIYLVSTELIYPSPGNAYQKKYMHRSFDGGVNWDEILFDSTSNALITNTMNFFNDSVGILRYGFSNFQITRNYGETWNSISLPVHEFSVLLNSDTLLLNNQNIGSINLTTLDFMDNTYNIYGIGGLSAVSTYGDTIARYNLGQNGPDLGYPDNNYSIISLDEMPLGNHRVLHFPQVQGLIKVELTKNSIFLLSGVPIRSTDSGYNFYLQESTEPDAADLAFIFLEFANDTIGYAISRNIFDKSFKIQKTTNSGGITSNYLAPPIQFTAGLNELSKKSVSIYPNPTTQNLTIESTQLIKEIEIIDLFGRSILILSDVNTAETNLDLSKFSNGNYIVKVSTDSNIEFHSLVKN